MTFDDGKSGTVDFVQWLEGAIFEPLKDTEFFQRFFLDGGTVCWPNGADIARETLYEQIGLTAMTAQTDMIEAHKKCSRHRTAISEAERCGCFHCCAQFGPGAITDWVDQGSEDTQSDTTALCPECGIDAVIPLGPGMDAQFLQRMKAYWF